MRYSIECDTKNYLLEYHTNKSAVAADLLLALPPQGTYQVIAIDPPWPYGGSYDPDTHRVASPYPEMSIEQLKGLEPYDWAKIIIPYWGEKVLTNSKRCGNIGKYYKRGCNKMAGIGMRGRHCKVAMVAGELVEIRSLVPMGNSQGISLPKLWLDFLRQKGDLQGIGIMTSGDLARLVPYYGENSGKPQEGDSQ